MALLAIPLAAPINLIRGQAKSRRVRRFAIAVAVMLGLAFETIGYSENSAIMAAPRVFPTNWMARHENFVAEAKKGGIDLLFFGDSITDGWNWDSGGSAIWKKNYAPRHAADFGIGYDRTQNVLWRIENGEVNNLKPRTVVLLIGTNNLGNEENGQPKNTPQEAAAGVSAIVGELRRRLPQTKILLFGIFPRGEKDNPIRGQIKTVNSRLEKLADGHLLKFVDIGAQFLSPDGTLPREMFPDLLHPNAKGYEIWSRAIDAALVNW